MIYKLVHYLGYSKDTNKGMQQSYNKAKVNYSTEQNKH